MSHLYTPAKTLLGNGGLDLDTHDIRARLLSTNTTADTEKGAATISAFTTLDEYVGTNYTALGKALASKAVNTDLVNFRAEFDANDLTWTSLGAGVRLAQGLLIYRYVDGTAANDIPIAWIDTGGFPLNGTGANFVVQFDIEGILWLA